MRECFEHFKNGIIHEVKRCGEIPFIKDIIEKNTIRALWDANQYEEALYLLAMIDYLSRRNNIPQNILYNDLRIQKFERPLFPNGIIMMDKLQPQRKWKENAINDAIPEFLRHNIIEGEVFDDINA